MMHCVREDRSLVWNLMEESLRYEAPIQGFYRKARQDMELAGKQIKAGDALCVLYAAGNRDPSESECPAEFNLDKARRDHLAFGKGVHYCLGASLARLETDIAIAVLDRFETLTAKSDYQVTWRKTPFFRGMDEYTRKLHAEQARGEGGDGAAQQPGTTRASYPGRRCSALLIRGHVRRSAPSRCAQH